MTRARASRLRAAAGIVGPAAFTLAWAASTRGQPAYSPANEHISGLAARGAENPSVMTAGFLTLGVSTVVFASELDRRLGGGERAGYGPALMAASGLAMLAAGLFRRDRVSNYPMPGEADGPQSWVNDVHDVASVAAGTFAFGSLAALAVRFAGDPAWSDLSRRAASAALTGGALSAWFARDVTRPGNGLVQRASVSIPLGFMSRMAWRMLRSPSR
jgi:hypothetical protein